MAMTLQSLLDKANRKLNAAGMNPVAAELTRQVITDMHAQGIYICVAQGFRSIAEQNALYAQGRTAPGSIVTNAKGGKSNHNFGVAVDLCLYTTDGSDVIWDVSGPFQKVIAAMKARGFKWGGDWTGFKDYPHFEICDAVSGEQPPKEVMKMAQLVTFVRTGGYSGDALKEVHGLLLQKNWGYTPARKSDGTLEFVVGGFTADAPSQAALAELVAFLQARSYWYDTFTM
ncbi:M15 family metallopeptidase [Ectobacillus ponti]|uniref:M15 family metallopeptidase n=1 Tax=Ectobacillus ponti TaxID=2961894 RepID=A0AA42BTR0_9BACI|nr:M15 family metallopeptidase [Ectobacillus ponti]MCP8969733.1 M15 family metallopeptidase [Ectobacillus ponti]